MALINKEILTTSLKLEPLEIEIIIRVLEAECNTLKIDSEYYSKIKNIIYQFEILMTEIFKAN